MPVAAFVALFVAAVQRLAAVMGALVPLAVMGMMPAAMTLAVMVAAVMARAVVVMVVACRVGVVCQRTLRQRLCRCVRAAGNARIEPNPSLGQRLLGTHADAAADQRVHLSRLQKARQRAVAAAVGADDLLADDHAVFHIVELELLRVSEVLKDLSVFIGYRDSHCMILRNCFLRPTVDWTALIMTVVLAAVYLGSWKISKKGISPIGLIGISAVAGIAVYGIKG